MRVVGFFLFFITLGFRGTSQSEDINLFSFETYTRGYRQSITIRSDSTFIRYAYQPEKNIRRQTKPSEWHNLTKAVAAYKLPELTNLPAPTNNRNRDAARSSKILIRTNRKSYTTRDFDDYHAPAKLAGLMAVIKKIGEGQPLNK